MDVKTVAPKDIEKELKALWECLEGQGKMRSCLYNLIVCTKASARVPYLREIVQKTIDKFPSRILFVTVGGTSKITSKVSVLSSEKIACDLIEIELPEGQSEHILFFVLPHLIPDLPIYLLWAEDPCLKDPTACNLEGITTRIIFDSESSENLSCFAKAALEHQSSTMGDLNWARIEGWRVLLSSIFHSPSKLEALKNTKRIHITYNAHQTPYFVHTRIQALYFQAWLATRLGWTFTSKEDSERGMTLQYGDVSISIEPVDFEQIAPGRIVTIEMTSSNGEHTLLQRNPELPHQIVIQHSTKELCSLPTYFMFAKYESGQSLVNEICHHGSSSHYIQVLELLASINHSGLPT
ncbi:MAG TPA: glucose-6-phosphate dehydrogenase assembly protein OpcA [Chlamydiales bacterium]|nr:glucose-6-phosphate dehydrogenase assembly protein OpcA [Chlamydiales bacterium]